MAIIYKVKKICVIFLGVTDEKTNDDYHSRVSVITADVWNINVVGTDRCIQTTL